jgi:hypothetical protein
MTTAVWRATILLMLVFLGLIALAYGSADRDGSHSALRDFLQPSAGCALPCWQGIRPGITGSLQAVDTLKAIPWVTDLYSIQGIVINDSFIRWGWTGQQPAIVDSQRDGQMWFHNGLVYEIDIPLNVSFSNVWAAFGPPEAVSALITPLMPPQASYRALYFHQSVEIRGNVVCPLNARNLLSTHMDARIAVPTNISYPAIARQEVCQHTNH